MRIRLANSPKPRAVMSGLRRCRLTALYGLDGPVMCAAQQRRRRKARKSIPFGDVEAGARVNLCRVRGVVLVGQRLNHLAASCVLFGLRRARPVNKEPLSAHLATDITNGIGNLAENLHSFSGLSEVFLVELLYRTGGNQDAKYPYRLNLSDLSVMRLRPATGTRRSGCSF